MELNLDMFQGLATLAASEPKIIAMRIFLIFLGFLMMYLARRGVLEALIMTPMGLGMATINAAVLFWDKEAGVQGTLFVNALVETTDEVMHWLQLIETRGQRIRIFDLGKLEEVAGGLAPAEFA